MKLGEKAAGSIREVSVDELVKRVQETLDAARRLGMLSQTMVRESDDGPMIVKMGASPLVNVSASQLEEFATEAGIPWEEGYEDRVIAVWASDERVDRDGDIVEQSWDFANYAKNPLVLWGHEWGTPPIGNAIHWSVEDREEDDYAGPALLLTELFAPGDANPQAESVLRLAKAGFLRSGSVGFFPGKVVTFDDDDAREELGLPEHGFLLQNNELIEHSHCSVPANPGAINILSLAKDKGGLSPVDIAAIRELARQDALVVGREDVWSRMDSVLRRAWKQLFPEVAIEDHKSIAEPIAPDSAVERKRCKDAPEDDAGKPVTRDEVLKPYPGEHACRIADPDNFSEFRRVNGDRESDGKSIDVIYGHIKDSEDWDVQALRYPKDEWTEDAARASCAENDGIEFEPASDEEDSKTPSIEDLHELLSKTVETVEELSGTVSEFVGKVGEIETALADLKSDVDGIDREDVQERAAELSGLILQLRENAEKALARGKSSS